MTQEIARQLFYQHFGRQPDHFYQAPGRVNLIGEHTDYNEGWVLPCAIDYQTVIAAQARDDHLVRVVSANFDRQPNQFDLRHPIRQDETTPWSNYVRGVVWALQQSGYPLRGVDLAIAGNIPPGAGLSSSAALELAVGWALADVSGLSIESQTLALVGQRAENDFVGVNCGIMDQFVSALGRAGHALLIDCRTLDYQSVPLPADMAIIIVNSHVKRGLVTSEYNLRRQQCQVAAAYFDRPALRDVSLEMLTAAESKLEPLIFRRARHVITENGRTHAAALALKNGDMARLSHLMAESQRSMRDDFEITVPPIEALVDMIAGVIGPAGGVRLTGGGFGGCVVAVVPPTAIADIKAVVGQQYPAVAGLEATIYRCQATAGAGRLG